MSREEYILDLIKLNGYNLKEFAHKIDMPYSTLRSLLSTSIKNTSFENVCKICKELDIPIEKMMVYDAPARSSVYSCSMCFIAQQTSGILIEILQEFKDADLVRNDRYRKEFYRLLAKFIENNKGKFY